MDLMQIVDRAQCAQKFWGKYSKNQKKHQTRMNELVVLGNEVRHFEKLNEDILLMETIIDYIVQLEHVRTKDNMFKSTSFLTYLVGMCEKLKVERNKYKKNIEKQLNNLPILNEKTYEKLLEYRRLAGLDDVDYVVKDLADGVILDVEDSFQLNGFFRGNCISIINSSDIERIKEVKLGLSGEKVEDVFEFRLVDAAMYIQKRSLTKGKIRDVKKELERGFRKIAANIDDEYKRLIEGKKREFNNVAFPLLNDAYRNEIYVHIEKYYNIVKTTEQLTKIKNIIDLNISIPYSMMLTNKITKTVDELKKMEQIYFDKIEGYKDKLRKEHTKSIDDDRMVSVSNSNKKSENNVGLISKKNASANQSQVQKQSSNKDRTSKNSTLEYLKQISRIIDSVTYTECEDMVRRSGGPLTDEEIEKARVIIINERIGKELHGRYDTTKTYQENLKDMEIVEVVEFLNNLLVTCKNELSYSDDKSNTDMYSLNDNGFSMLELLYEKKLKEILKESIDDDLRDYIEFYLSRYDKVRNDISGYALGEARKKYGYYVRIRAFENTVLINEIQEYSQSKQL